MRQYVIDAFTDHVFSGNPAAVCIMDSWPADGKMLDIARENNLPETAFAVKEGGKYRLRWFTTAGEVNLCGHATLAAACALMTFVEPEKTELVFATRSGDLPVIRRGGLFELDLPAYALTQVPVTREMVDAMNGARPAAAYMGDSLLCVFDDEETVRQMRIDTEKGRALPGGMLHVTAPGRETDCVSRCCSLTRGEEDPVCGYGHCHIVPYWTKTLGKDTLVAYQASSRGGMLYCTQEGDRIKMSGKAAIYSVAEIRVD